MASERLYYTGKWQTIGIIEFRGEILKGDYAVVTVGTNWDGSPCTEMGCLGVSVFRSIDDARLDCELRRDTAALAIRKTLRRIQGLSFNSTNREAANA